MVPGGNSRTIFTGHGWVPRTERGKSIARFNAVTLGLFAKHVVIPICDGYKPERDSQSLLDGLHQSSTPSLLNLEELSRCLSANADGAALPTMPVEQAQRPFRLWE